VLTGVLRHLRHPWYLAGLLLLWGRDLAARDLVTATLLSGYLYLGSVLEERRLLAEFGDRYRRYQRAVPASSPFPAPRVTVSDLQNSRDSFTINRHDRCDRLRQS